MTRGWKIIVMVAAVAVIAVKPLFWLLDSPGTGQLVGASVQAAAGIAALIWALFQRPQTWQEQTQELVDRAVKTGTAEATESGSASSGVRAVRGVGRRRLNGPGTRGLAVRVARRARVSSTPPDQADTSMAADGAAAGVPVWVKAEVSARVTGDAHAAEGGTAVAGY
ncbi:hypothetical protein ACFXHD_00165 [Streptomyces hydrogenans]|uniref:hypothetical protein n=1 Tax=Streptomyces hydrogenans TaxID=1873719 RepID=UPI0036BC1D54